MRRILGKIWPFGVMMIVIFVFFYRLFIPPSIFVTPDFGRSNIWQLLIDNKSGILTTD